MDLDQPVVVDGVLKADKEEGKVPVSGHATPDVLQVQRDERFLGVLGQHLLVNLVGDGSRLGSLKWK